uniref:Uncharacterized protein LOC100187291 n=1 Tax=Phallusia mammillata TaxID=59560 RepID=A0A6F9DJD2_9ASCI|nr:uncharacterized protein LOC100187291 [Phallusia mammillata]
MKRCCLNIQSYYRGHAARQRYQLLKDQAEEKQRNIAATLIQSSWKGHIKRREFFSLKKATITIQAWYRSVKAKQNYLKIKNAVVTIQLKWMATMQARKVQKDFKALKSAVITVQAARRAIVQRRKFLATKNATVTIQSFVKGWLARKQYKAAKLALRKRNKAAVCIQSAWRAFKARQMFIKIRNATVTIQRHWKATVLARKQRSQFLKQKISCLQIQSCYRGYRVRQQFLIYLRQKTEKTQRNNAAIIIQSACKGYQAKQEYLCKKKAAITIQSRYKAFKARQNYLMVRKAVVIIQRKWKATLLANRIRKEFKVLKSSVVKLQAVRRMIVQRRKFLEIKSAAILIQAHFRGWSIRRTYIAKREAAIKIQAYFRRILCQKSYLAKRNAADCMQKRFRAKQLANATRAQFMKQKQSAILIQAFYRGYTARKQFKLMQEKARNEKAAIVLQSWIRGCQQRQAYALLLEKKAAKRKLQLMMIGMAAQDHLNAIIIQRAYRRSVVRAHHKQHMQHVVLVQRTWRAKLMRRKFVKMRKAAVVIQRQYRRHFFHRQQKVILIQRWWRTLMENRKVKQQYKASLKIQAAWRGYKVRKSMLVFPGIAFQRAKLEEATKRASLHPENTIYNRMVLALGILFNKKYLNQVRSALEELERVSGLVGICCVHITDAGGPRELFRLLGVCNRDFGSGSVARLSLRILTNLLSNPPSSEAVKLIMDENIDDIVNVFPKYQDRGGRDKSSRPVFIAACDLLLVYLRDSQRAKDFVENHQLNVQRIKNIQKETERRYKKQNERSSIQRRMTEIHAVGYLNDSTMIAEQSFVKERSFVKGMFVSMASTSTPTRSKAPKLPEATSKQKITSKKPKVKAALVKQPTEATRAHSRPKTAAKAHVAVPAVRKEALKPAESGAGPSRRRSVQPGRITQAKSEPVAPDLAEKALHKLNMICDIFELYK